MDAEEPGRKHPWRGRETYPFKEEVMRERDEGPYIVVARDGGRGLGSFILGALVGAGLALLFAPKSGEETQEEIKARALKFKDAARERVRDAQETLEDRLKYLEETLAEA